MRLPKPTTRTLVALLVAAAIGAGMFFLARWLMDQNEDARVSSHRSYIEHYAAEYGLPPELIEAVIRAESGGRVKAVSSKGAEGLMQVTETAEQDVLRHYGIEKDVKRRRLIWIRQNKEKQVREVDLFDPEYNIQIGTAYLRMMLERFGGDTYLALAAYNMGPTKLSRLRREQPGLSSRQLVEKHAPTETRRYCRRILELLDGRFAHIDLPPLRP